MKHTAASLLSNLSPDGRKYSDLSDEELIKIIYIISFWEDRMILTKELKLVDSSFIIRHIRTHWASNPLPVKDEGDELAKQIGEMSDDEFETNCKSFKPQEQSKPICFIIQSCFNIPYAFETIEQATESFNSKAFEIEKIQGHKIIPVYDYQFQSENYIHKQQLLKAIELHKYIHMGLGHPVIRINDLLTELKINNQK